MSLPTEENILNKRKTVVDDVFDKNGYRVEIMGDVVVLTDVAADINESHADEIRELLRLFCVNQDDKNLEHFRTNSIRRLIMVSDDHVVRQLYLPIYLLGAT